MDLRAPNCGREWAWKVEENDQRREEGRDLHPEKTRTYQKMR